MRVVVNGLDLYDAAGFVGRRRHIPRLGGERTTVLAVEGRPGGVRAGASVEPGRLWVEGTIARASHAAALTALDTLAAGLAGECVLRFPDISDREWIGWYQQGDGAADAIDPQWISRGAAVRLDWILPDPTARAQVETVQGAGAVALGTAPSPLRLEISAAAGAALSNLHVEVRRGAVVLQRLDWVGNVPAGGQLVIDSNPNAYAVTSNGVAAFGGLTRASAFPLSADPSLGADQVAVWADAGLGAVVLRYRKRWK